jgi:hypothetical protein
VRYPNLPPWDLSISSTPCARPADSIHLVSLTINHLTTIATRHGAGSAISWASRHAHPRRWRLLSSDACMACHIPHGSIRLPSHGPRQCFHLDNRHGTTVDLAPKRAPHVHWPLANSPPRHHPRPISAVDRGLGWLHPDLQFQQPVHWDDAILIFLVKDPHNKT